MNARLYDPLLHRFLAPDDYIQDPTNTQNFNRYGYVLNNPLKYTDPNGKFFWLAAAAICGIVSWLETGSQISWQGLGYFAVGFGSGYLASAAGAGMTAFLGGGGALGSGFMSSGLVGATGGFVGGFTSGLGNSLVSGKGFGSSLGSAFLEGGFGGLSGGLVSGVIGGINAEKDGRSFFSGRGSSNEAFFINDNGGEGQYSTNSEMRQEYNNNIGSKDNWKLEDIERQLDTKVTLGENSNLPNGYSVNTENGLINTEVGTAGGVTHRNFLGGFFNRSETEIFAWD